MPESPAFTVSEFIDVCNDALDLAYRNIIIEGEVASFKVNQGKWVFFDLKDDQSSLGCFLPLFQLRVPLEDGMKVKVQGVPKLTKWGKFSFTVKSIIPVGDGSIKKAFDLLKAKLEKEGLFDPLKKRPLPDDLTKIGVISSTQAAGYADFIKILNERWGGLNVQVAHTGVQGFGATEQIIRALDYFNQQAEMQVIAIIRGGGSADDLAIFNDEKLVRAVAASRIPVITGIGHEVDQSLVDLAADIEASTPSNVAQLLTPDRQAEVRNLHATIMRAKNQLFSQINFISSSTLGTLDGAKRQLLSNITAELSRLEHTQKILEHLNPEQVLVQGYAIVTGAMREGGEVTITTADKLAKATINSIKERSNNG